VVDEAVAQRWLDAYGRAWATYDRTAIADLFSEDATYRWHPWDTGAAIAHGRKAIVEAWLDGQDKPGTYAGDWRPLLVHDDTVIAVGVSRYYTDATHRTLDREYHNLWVIELDAEGRCRSFTEWFMKTPKPRRKS
jgi:ketosteroid isomerase-like protein